ncbi:MAG: ATP-dependent zinc metalloprotease FtsH [Gammaproteobacteria bacterium]|nr:ATP-dependent zinc metalloprotease FtsH [Gammaproteobacteria bacterium]
MTDGETPDMWRRWSRYVLMAAAIGLLYMLLVRMPYGPPRYEIAYSDFTAYVRQDRVAEVTLRGEHAEGRLTEPQPIGPGKEPGTQFLARIPSFGGEGLLSLLDEHGVRVRVGEDPTQTGLYPLLFALLPWVVLFGFFWWVMRRSSQMLGNGRLGPGSELRRFLERSTEQAKVPEVSFADVAGQDNAKREVTELVEYLKDPARFQKLGAEVPHGVLLMGPPGTGKTLLARALAGEAGVPFFSISGSEFIEVFVGVGASRVRNLFDAAKKRAPAIIFIDELDSIGRTRGTGLGGGHDEREQTLNQILAEMDGFEGHEAVLIVAATNRPDVLDPALLRPGRFDRHVTLDLPDRNDREAILRVHTRKVPLDSGVDLTRIANGTSGFSGADLKNLVNEAAIRAAREHRERVLDADFEDARDRLLLGTVRTLAIQPEERHRLAVHEAGHTLVAHHTPHSDPLFKVTIIPRGRSLGGTHQLPEEERHTVDEDYLRDRLAVILGGRNAEKELLGTVSSGADDDIRQATRLARSMVSRWGMSEDIGPVDLREDEEHPFLGREVALPRRYSEHSAQAVDLAVQKLLNEAERRARQTLLEHRAELDRLITALEERETLHREDIEALLGPKSGAHRPADTGAGLAAAEATRRGHRL